MSGPDALALGVSTLSSIMQSPQVEAWVDSAWVVVSHALCNIRSKILEYDPERDQDVEMTEGTITAPLDSLTIERDMRIRVGGEDGQEYRATERLSSVAQQQWRITGRVYITVSPDRGRA